MCLKEIGLQAQNLLPTIGGGEGFTWPSYGLLCQWTLMIHNNSGLAQRFSGINPGFFRCVCEHKEITISLSE